MYLSTVGNPEYDTYMLLRQTNQLLDKIISRRCRLQGLTGPGLEVLYTAIAGPKPLSAYMLARILGREHHSVVEIVNRLKTKGWITRQTIEGKPSLQATETGIEVVGKVLSTPALRPLFESLGKSGREKLRNALTPLRAKAMHDLGLLDLGGMEFAPVEDVKHRTGATKAKK